MNEGRSKRNKEEMSVTKSKYIELNETYLLQNELLTYLWYLNFGCTLRGLGVIQKFNNDDNDD